MRGERACFRRKSYHSTCGLLACSTRCAEAARATTGGDGGSMGRRSCSAGSICPSLIAAMVNGLRTNAFPGLRGLSRFYSPFSSPRTSRNLRSHHSRSVCPIQKPSPKVESGFARVASTCVSRAVPHFHAFTPWLMQATPFSSCFLWWQPAPRARRIGQVPRRTSVPRQGCRQRTWLQRV